MNEFITNFIGGLLGDKPLYIYAVCMVFCAIGAYVITRIRAKDRKRTSVRTPDNFSFIFMVVNNVKDVFLALSISFIVFRFSNKWIDDEAFLFGYAFLLGLCFNALVIAVGIIEKRLSKKITDRARRV